MDQTHAINPPPGSQFSPNPQLVTNSFGAGAWSLNYRNEPLDIRLNPYDQTRASDTAFGFASIKRANPLLNVQPSGPISTPPAPRAAAATPTDHTSHAAVTAPAAPAPAPAATAGDGTLSIAGDIVGGRPVWTVNDQPLANNGSVQLKKGQLVRFSIKAGTHGILFKSQAAAEAVFDIASSPQASKFVPNPRGSNTCNNANSYGTAPQGAGGDNTIAEVRVKADATISGPGLDFECTQHCANMAGVMNFATDDTLSIAGDIVGGRPVWTVNDQPLANNGSVQLKKGQLVRFSIKAGTHGILFKSQAAAEAVFDIAASPQASKFVPNPRGPNTCNNANSYGTAPQGARRRQHHRRGTGQGRRDDLGTGSRLRVLAALRQHGRRNELRHRRHAVDCRGHRRAAGRYGPSTASRWRTTAASSSRRDSSSASRSRTARTASCSRARRPPTRCSTSRPRRRRASSCQNPRGPNTCNNANSYGTAPQAAGTGDNTIAEVRVKADATISGPGLDFECTQHCANMAGVFNFAGDDTLSIAGDIVNGKPVWVVNDKRAGEQRRRPAQEGTARPLLGQERHARHSVQEPGGRRGHVRHRALAAGEQVRGQEPVRAQYCNRRTTTAPRHRQPAPATTPSPRCGSRPTRRSRDRVSISSARSTAPTWPACSTFEIPAVNLTGDVANGQAVWRLNGAVMANGKSVPLIPGQKVRFTVANGTHGLVFPDQATAEALFDIAGSPQASKFVANPNGANTCGLPNAFGTTPQAAVANPGPGANTIAELVVKRPFSLAQPGQWMCSQHCQHMQGLFVPEDTTYFTADPDDTQWLVDNDMLPNNTPILLEPGRKLRVAANKPATLFFRDAAAPASLFEDASAFTPMNKCSINGAGLTLKTDGTYTELTAKKATTATLASFMSGELCQKMEGYAQPHVPLPPFTYPEKFEGAEPFDPYTPLMRAYPGDTVEIRTLVGAHMASHSFNMHGVKWLFEQNSPNSGFRSTQGMGISEYYHMRFEVPTTNTGADYLYVSTSDTKGLEYGQWGLLRAYGSPQPDLPPIQPPAKTADVCAADAPAKSTYKVSVVSRDALPGNFLIYNDRGLPFANGAGKIVGLSPLIYVHDEDLVDPNPNARPAKLKPSLGTRIEPLILRAAAGDCIDVTVTNRIPDAYQRPWRQGSGQAFKDISLYTSRHVSLHAQQVGMDVLTSNGVTIGQNPSKTVWKNGDSVKLRWYAGSIGADGSRTPVELGAIGLTPADPLMQHPLGLLGALIIEPAGATWQTDQNSRAQATVTTASGKFREFVLVLQDDVQLGLLKPHTAPYNSPKKGAPSQRVEAAPSNWSRAFNYRTEPLPYRYKDPNSWLSSPPPVGIARALSNQQVGGDPQTPVLAVSKGTPTRLRVVHPGGLSEQTFTLSGHPWQEEPFRSNSREIGENGASQWFGGRDSFGANDQTNILMKSAGGRNKVTGDYLYRSFIGEEFTFGLWGVMRVGEPGSDIVTIARASDGPTGFGFIISGANTVNPDTGKMATSVTIRASVRLPDAKDPKQITCKVPVDRVSGQWSSAICPETAQGKLEVSRTRPVEVVSDERGRASVTAPIQIPAVAPSAELVAREIDAIRAEGQKRETVQFLGERTPTIQIPGASTPRTDPIPSAVPRPDNANRPSSSPIQLRQQEQNENRRGVGDGETPRH